MNRDEFDEKFLEAAKEIDAEMIKYFKSSIRGSYWIFASNLFAFALNVTLMVINFRRKNPFFILNALVAFSLIYSGLYLFESIPRRKAELEDFIRVTDNFHAEMSKDMNREED